MLLKPQHRIYISFFLFAASTGPCFPACRDLQAALDVDKAELGLTLIGMAIGSLISLTLSSPLIVRLGTRNTVTICLSGLPVFSPSFRCSAMRGPCSGAVPARPARRGAGDRAQCRDRPDRGPGRVRHHEPCPWLLESRLLRDRGHGIGDPPGRHSMQMHMHLVLGLVAILAAATMAGMRNAPEIVRRDEQAAPHFALPTLGLLPLC